MKSVAQPVVDAIRQGHEVVAVPRLTAEWNLNRYSDVQVDNDPSDDLEGYDIEMFPVESLVQPNRPTAGIMKARIGEARIADVYSQHTGKARSARYYLADVDDIYKYWTSPVQTTGSGYFPTANDGQSKVRPHVLYPNLVDTNKIVIGFEDTWAQPNSFEVRVRNTVGGAWTTISTSPNINSWGQVILYWNGVGWSTNKPDSLAGTKTIAGIQVRINSLRGVAGGSPTGAYAYASVIEISARLEADLTSRLVSVSDTFDMSEKSQVYPIGTVTTNTADITLFNGDGMLNNENPDSPYYGLAEPNVKFNLEYVYDIEGVQYPVQQFNLYGGAWEGQRAEEVNIQCGDFSKFFQEIKPRQATYTRVTLPEIVWRLCDSIGFSGYEIDLDDLTTHHKIPIFWCDGDQTMWQILDDLAQATQTAIYFDSWGKLQIRTRTAAFKSARAVDWTLRGKVSGSELADIAEISQTDEVGSNNIKVTYQTTEFDPVVGGRVSSTQILWEPEDTVTLRGSALRRTLERGDEFIFLSPEDAEIWPYEGMVNIDGEIIKYSGKRYAYHDQGQFFTRVVNSQDEKDKYDARTPYAQRYRNYFTGGLYITERGVWNSEAKRHPVDAEGYSTRHVAGGVHRTDVYGFHHNRTESKITLTSGARFNDPRDILVSTKGSQNDPGFYYYGTKIKFEKDAGSTDQRGGLVIHSNGPDEDGYYIELKSSDTFNRKTRDQQHELIFFSRKNGNIKRFGANGGRGIPLSILEGRYYEIDIYFNIDGSGDHNINIWINGRNAMTAQVEGSWRNDFGGRFGVFLRGDTKVSFEYLYAIARDENQPEDDFSFLNKVETGYTGGQWDREWVYRWRTQRRRTKKGWTKEKERWKVRFFDDFGPYVHEIREYNIKFEPSPALTAKLYLGNDYSIICPEFKADSFGAKFYLANTARGNAIANGEDNLTFGNNGVSIIMAVVGRAVVVSESETVVAKDDEQIRKRGIIETELSSPWIQSKKMANDIADWIKNHWSKGADEQTVNVFGNPLIEIGDVVAISHPELDMAASSHKYFVVGTSSSFDTGLETTLTLRRIV